MRVTADNFVELATRTESKPSEEIIRRLTACVRDIHAILGKLTELGELADQFKRHIFYLKDLDVTNIKEELGDDKWYDALLMDEHGLTFDDILGAVIAKLRVRYPEKFDQAAAIQRDLIAERTALETPQDPGTVITPWPEEWPPYYNSNTPCDALIGPCSCGAWHAAGEFRLVDCIIIRQLGGLQFKSSGCPNSMPELITRGTGVAMPRDIITPVLTCPGCGVELETTYVCPACAAKGVKWQG